MKGKVLAYRMYWFDKKNRNKPPEYLEPASYSYRDMAIACAEMNEEYPKYFHYVKKVWVAKRYVKNITFK